MSFDWNKLIELKAGDQASLLSALADAGCEVHGPKKIRCGFHDDNNPSGNLYEKDGHWRYKCHSCGWIGDWFDVVAESRGLNRNEVIKQFVQDQNGPNAITPKPTPAKKKEVKTYASPRDVYNWLKTRCEKVKPYRYIDPATGKDDLIVFRCEPALDGKKRKGFVQCTPYGDGFALRGVEGKLPLYSRRDIAELDDIIVCEGEKAAQALIDIGLCATTAPGGAGKDAADVDWSPLQDKTVYLWPDNDEAGVAWMGKVEAALEHIAETVITLPAGVFDLPEKSDAYDAIAYFKREGVTEDAMRRAILCELADAQPSRPSDLVGEFIEDQIAGRFRAVPFEFDLMSNMTKAMLPGTVTVLCGDPNDGKSFLLLQSADYWLNKEDVRVAIYELEDDKRYHLMRSLAQTAGDSHLLDDRWVQANPDDARGKHQQFAGRLDKLGRSMWDAPDRLVKLEELTGWVRERCQEGYRIIAIDPITATSTGDNRFQDDLDFVISIKILARQYEVSVVLITHPKKGRKQAFGLDELAGGAAYSRFTHTVLWIKRHDQPEEADVWEYNLSGLFHRKQVTMNRTIHLSKVRNGPGAGKSLAYYFDPKTLRFSELGDIVKKEGAA